MSNIRDKKGQFVKGNKFSKGQFIKGNKLSEETKRKMSKAKKGIKPINAILANTGKHPSEETKRKISKALMGKVKSIKTRKKLSEAHMGNKYHLGFKHSEEAKRKMGEAFKGRKHSEEAKKKIGEASKGNKHRLGKYHTEETKMKMSMARRGENASNWQGGKSFEPYPTDWIEALRESIRQRDNYTCQLCGIHQDKLGGRFKKLDIHHIDYDKDNLNPKNLVSLCRSCHPKTNFNRKYWPSYLIFNKEEVCL